MIIEFSIALLEELKLTPNEFYVITLVKHKEFNILQKFLEKEYTREETNELFIKFVGLKYLTGTSYISNDYDWSNCKIGNTLFSLLKTDDIFEEFLEEYPSSVIRTDGVVDYLRVDQKQCRIMYLKHTNLSIARHEHIMKCLKFEIEKRKREGSMKFMLRMNKWLIQEAWKSYEDEVNSSNTIKENTYGTELE